MLSYFYPICRQRLSTHQYSDTQRSIRICEVRGNLILGRVKQGKGKGSDKHSGLKIGYPRCNDAGAMSQVV